MKLSAVRAFSRRALLPGTLLVGAGAIAWLLGAPGHRHADVAHQSSEAATSVAPAPERGDAATSLVAAPAEAAPASALEFVAPPADAATMLAALALPTRDPRFVRLDRAFFAGKFSPLRGGEIGTPLPLTLPTGLPVVARLTGREQLGPDRFIVRATLDGHPNATVHFSLHGELVHAVIDDVVLGQFELRDYGRAEAVFFQTDPGVIPNCGGTPVKFLDGDLRAALAERAIADASTTEIDDADPAAATALARGEIDLLMLYTQAVREALQLAGSPDPVANIQAFFDLAIASVNDDYARSDTRTSFRLVGLREIAYSPDTPTSGTVSDLQSTALSRLRNRSDGWMDTAHTWRNELGADLVCLAVHRDSSSAGIAYLLDGPDSALNPYLAFSVIDYQLATSQRVLSHELGHNLGCAHDRENSSSPGAYDYSYGYRFNGANGTQYRTLMAYAPGSRINYFSNPDITHPAPISVPLGVPVGQSQQTDNARTIRNTAFEAQQFRLAKKAAPFVGRLVNVSTRAWVGTGDQVLIGGFNIEGTVARRILLRAGGPALAPALGAAAVLADPEFRVVRMADGVTVATNDNWWQQAGAADFDAASVRAAGQSYSAGSLDSGLLLELTGGGYTAVVSGKGGTTGTAIIEAFEVDGGVPRLVNLSTRGYMSKAQPMIGGFVVSGTPGETKRILIRVGGPSLAGVLAGAADDPMLELYNADSELVLSNDDWDYPSTNYAGEIALQRGTVDTVAEQAIFDTGYAPANPREPAIIVDLLPGNYTALVKPFERLPDQIEAPGIAIVEVYELTR